MEHEARIRLSLTRRLDTIQPTDFEINRMTLSDLNILSTLFFRVPSFAPRILSLVMGSNAIKSVTERDRKHQINRIEAMCQHAVTQGARLRGPYFQNELTLAAIFFCEVYCPGELQDRAKDWQRVRKVLLSAAYSRAERQMTYLNFLNSVSKDWLECYERLTSDPDMHVFESRSHRLWPKTKLWSRHAIDAFYPNDPQINFVSCHIENETFIDDGLF